MRLRCIDRVGRVGCAVASYAIGAAFLIPVALGATDIFGFGFACLFVALAAATAGSSVTWVHVAELYPTEIRSTAHTVAYVVSRVGAFLSGFVVDSDLTVASATWVLVVFSALAAVASFGLKETAGLQLDEHYPIGSRPSPHSSSPRRRRL
jgi:hypothetical protein